MLDLNDTVAGMLKMLRRLIGEDIDLAWQPARAWPVKIDPAQIDQILANLCVNARDAIAGVGKITIETGKRRLDEAYCADHPGFVPGRLCVPGGQRQRLRHGQGDHGHTSSSRSSPPSRMGKGTGLGLATVYGIVQAERRLHQRLQRAGAGHDLPHLPAPALRRTAPETQAQAPKAPPRGSETVLLVEDEPAILKMGKTMLERLGYTVLAAASPAEALRLAEEHGGEIHLLITDVVMPEMNGRELAMRVRALHPGIKCLFMSGYTADVIAHHGVLDEGVHFIQKPFSLRDLAAQVKSALVGD